MKELAALAYRDTTSENRTFWKNEMSKALRESKRRTMKTFGYETGARNILQSEGKKAF